MIRHDDIYAARWTLNGWLAFVFLMWGAVDLIDGRVPLFITGVMLGAGAANVLLGAWNYLRYRKYNASESCYCE